LAISPFVSAMWSTSGFRDPELAGYAEDRVRADTRLGVQILAALSLLAQLSVAVLVAVNGSVTPVLGTNLVVGLLSLHVLVSAKFVHDVKALHLLGMSFLVLSALAITFLAHKAGDLTVDMMAAIALLFIAIPLIPWALREAAAVVALTYFMLTTSLVSVPGRFDSHSLVVLQLLVIGAALVALVVTGRNTIVRKHDIRMRFELEKAHAHMEELSMKDHLTGAWNRRYLDEQFPRMLAQCRRNSRPMHMAVLDIDDFKGINDRFGHHIGDEVLIALASVFVEKLGDKGCLFRLGGDEFLILYCGDDLEELITSAITAIQKSAVAASLAGQRSVTLSAGIVKVGPGQPAKLEDLYKTADCALYSAKSEGRPITLSDDSGDEYAFTGTWKI